MMSYTEIYLTMKDDPDPKLKIKSPQTARNVCERALKKMKCLLAMQGKQDIVEFLSYINLPLEHEVSEGLKMPYSFTS